MPSLKSRNRTALALPVLSGAHFCVDFACILLLTCMARGRFGPTTELWWRYALMYNFCAFALQLPLGIALDQLRRAGGLSALGCALVGLAWLLPLGPMARAVTAGVGNALFHIGGGVHVLRQSPGAGAVGVFVSTGALGVFLGYRLTGTALLLPPLLMLLCAAGVLLVCAPGPGLGRAPFLPPAGSLLPIACLFLTVFIRAAVGGALSYSWRSPTLPWLSVAGVVLGKALGGLTAARLGMKKTAWLSLTAAGLLFAASFRLMWLGVAAVFLFNMTMPLTVAALSRRLGGMHGLAFGLTTLALFLGTLPSLFQADGPIFTPWGLIIACAASALLLAAGLEKEKRT